MTKKIISIIAVAALAFSVSAQSARLQGLANISVIDDPSFVTSTPSDIFGVKDIFQATFTTSTAADEIFAVKGIGDVLALGFYWDQDRIVSNFYSIVQGALGSTTYSNLTDRYQKVPHLLLGLELGDINLGADLFFENARYKYSIETDTYDTIIDPQDYSEKGRVTNPGILLGADLEVGDMGLAVNAGVSFPNVKIELWDAVEEKNYVATDSDKGIFFMVNALLSLELLDLDWTIGAGIDYEAHKFKTLANAADSTEEVFYEKNSVLNINGLLGVSKELPNDLILGVEDAFTASNDITTPDDPDAGVGNRETKIVTLTHNLSFGIEKRLTNLKRFDNIGLRFGINKPVVTTINKSEGEGNDSTTTLSLFKEKTKDGTDWGDFSAVIGFGVEKGRFAFDVFMDSDLFNPSNWNYGILSGAPVAGATVTFDFNKKSSRKAVTPAESYSAPVSTPASTYESTPASTYESTPATTDESTNSDGGSFDF